MSMSDTHVFVPVLRREEPVAKPNGNHTVAAPQTPPAPQDLNDVRNLFRALGGCCRRMVQGRDDVITLLLTALIADGHVLLEDHPGSGKTTLAKALGNALTREPGDVIQSFRRIQFTPDLLPSDVTGGGVFNSETRSISFQPGPVFANVVLADEINRTSPKVQAALLEAMAEKQVTVDNTTHKLDEVFFVLATQNPLDLAGTYPLPRAQLDRFLFKVKMAHLQRDAEVDVLKKWKTARTKLNEFAVTPHDLLRARRVVESQVKVPDMVLECLADIAEATRHDQRIALGVSTRSLVIALPALQVWALISGRDIVTVHDVKALAIPLFSHRVEPSPGVVNVDAVIAELTAKIVEKYTSRTLI